MAKKCSVFVISNKLFFHRHFALFLDYNPVCLHAYVGVLLTVNHWFLSLQYAFARVRRFPVLLLNIFPIFPFSHFPNGKWCFYISYYISIYYLFYYIEQGREVLQYPTCRRIYSCWKSFYKSVPSVPLSHCPKWNYVFCLSHYLSIYYLFYYNFYCLFGTVVQWDTWDTWYSFPLFSISLAISLRSTFAMPHVIVFA